MEKLRILIADEELKARTSLRKLLEELEHTVVSDVDNGVKAIEAARAHKPDAIIMDVKMPEMDGIEAARQITGERPCALIFLTAFSDDQLIVEAGEIGALSYIMKPLRKEDLAPAIQIAIQRFRQIQSLAAEVETLKDNLETRKLIDRAKGILMTRAGLTEDDAYKRIHHQARNQNKKMRDIAQSIITASELM